MACSEVDCKNIFSKECASHDKIKNKVTEANKFE